MSTVDETDLVFENLSYMVKDEVESKKQKREIQKRILNDLTGYFLHNKFTAILGPSGAGKTSLLEVISGQSKSGTVTGKLYLNGNSVSIKKIKELSGFVFQDDVILKTMTVKEALYMSALLRLPKEISNEEKMERVENMINLLHLEKCQDTIVGDSLIKGISGGERKRLSVGMEIIMNPSIIFLDEPTSGLDTFTAYSLIKNLKDLTKSGRTVIATIHQPSSEILGLFDNVILLNQGQIIYQDEAKNLVKYFSQIGYQCPEYSNPSDYIFMNVFNSTIDEENNIDINEKHNQIVEKYKETGMEEEIKKKSEELNTNKKEISNNNQRYVPEFGLQLKFLLKRQLKNIIRDKAILRLKFGQAIGMGLIVGLTFLNIPGRGDNIQVQIQDRNGSLFISCLSQIFLPVIGTLALFSIERPVIMREINSRYYGTLSYYLSKMIIEIPMQIIIALITITIIYWLCLFQKKFTKYISFIGIIELGGLCGLSLGISIATAAKNINAALSFAPFILIPLILFSGLLINSEDIPPYFVWIQYLSPIRYMYQEIYKIEFKGLYYKGIPLEINIDNMGFNKISTILAVLLLAGITIVLFIISFFILLLSIKNSLSKTKYYLSENRISELNSEQFLLVKK